MISGTFFFALRVLQLLTLIPIWGILAFFVNEYTKASTTAPEGILCLFIVAILATVWTLVTLVTFPRSELVVAIIDLCFFGVLIAGVALLAPWAENTDCVQGGWGWGNVYVSWQKRCSMFKAAWAFGIMNIIMFFATAVLAALMYRRVGTVYAERPRRGGYVV